ncbi:hypothetical protein QAD02_003146 [Eretmocerus hayati]|uniref:Uncharacterized protein n=1 Tax=Eretmocerus hayati TaxID=131215 RepID=A0ACC2NLC1_9HYME|nr:hypothetical protein QAD02_003146 [Eretmocerus hayati]
MQEVVILTIVASRVIYRIPYTREGIVAVWFTRQCERRENEYEASRRLKTGFLVEFDGLPKLNMEQVIDLSLNPVCDITLQDFLDTLKRVCKSVSPGILAAYEKWNLEFGYVSL